MAGLPSRFRNGAGASASQPGEHRPAGEPVAGLSDRLYHPRSDQHPAALFLFALGNYSAGNIGGIIGNVIWLSYVLMSRRVNVTFRRRVEREDEWLARGLAAAGAPALAPAPAR
jgi:hypothetical protein